MKLAASALVVFALLALGHGHRMPKLLAAPQAVHGSNQAVGQHLAAAYGWGGGAQWTCLDQLWTRESGWQMVWNYQGSGAYGIPQALPASKMASAGADYMTNPATQIRWGLGYIRGRYGDPCAAWSHETANSWYLGAPL